MAQQPVKQRARLGFGENGIVRDEPSVLVAEEGRFPASVWWGCVLACLFAWFLTGSLGMINLSSVLADVRDGKPHVLLILITMSGVLALASGFKRFTIQDGEAIVVTERSYLTRHRINRIPLPDIDFVSCDRQTITSTTDDGTQETDMLFVTVYLKNGTSQTVWQCRYCPETVAAIERHLPGVCIQDAKKPAS